MSEMKTLKFPGDAEPREIVDAKAREDISALSEDKVSVADIVNDLTTNVAHKPLSAAQGVALKAMINAITVPVIDNTLTKSGAAADAKAVGDAISSLSEEIANIPGGQDGKSAYQYAQDGGYTGTEAEFAAKLAAEYLPLSGGTMTGKIVIPIGDQNVGIANDGDIKILGYGSGYFRFGDPSYPMQMRGSGTNPLYGDKNILLEGDVYSKDKIDAALGSYITDVAALVGGDA